MNRAAYTVKLAPKQNSPRSIIIGIATRSSKDQNFSLLNEWLVKDTGISGIEASFQNINQVGVTSEF